MRRAVRAAALSPRGERRCTTGPGAAPRKLGVLRHAYGGVRYTNAGRAIRRRQGRASEQGRRRRRAGENL